MLDFQGKLYVVRHGQTDWNKMQKKQGWKDIPINNQGRKEAEEVSKELKNITAYFDVCISSDLQRAKETAEIIGKEIQYKTIEENELLREIDMGLMVSKTLEEYKEMYPHNHPWENLQECFLEGESFQELKERAHKALKTIHQKHQGQMILIVTHGGTMRAIKSILDNIDHSITIKMTVPNLCIHKY